MVYRLSRDEVEEISAYVKVQLDIVAPGAIMEICGGCVSSSTRSLLM